MDLSLAYALGPVGYATSLSRQSSCGVADTVSAAKLDWLGRELQRESFAADGPREKPGLRTLWGAMVFERMSGLADEPADEPPALRSAKRTSG